MGGFDATRSNVQIPSTFAVPSNDRISEEDPYEDGIIEVYGLPMIRSRLSKSESPHSGLVDGW